MTQHNSTYADALVHFLKLKIKLFPDGHFLDSVSIFFIITYSVNAYFYRCTCQKLCNRNPIGQCVPMEIIKIKINILIQKTAVIIILA